MPGDGTGARSTRIADPRTTPGPSTRAGSPRAGDLDATLSVVILSLIDAICPLALPARRPVDSLERSWTVAGLKDSIPREA